VAIFTNILTGGSNNHETTSENVNGVATDLLTPGVVGATTNTAGVSPATGPYAVNEQSPAAMAVDVSSGIAYVTATPTGQFSQNLRVRSTATEEVTIAANSTGSTRYDWVYLSVDPDDAADPAVDGDNVTTLVVSRSTSSVSDDGTPPTYGLVLAVVTVANAAASITNGNISDRRATGVVDTQAIADEAVTPDKTDFGAATTTNNTSGTTTSTSYTATLTSGGTSPAVTLDVPASGKVLVMWTAELSNDTAGSSVYIGVAVSGANTVAAADAESIRYRTPASSGSYLQRWSVSKLFTGLTPGSTTFTLQYRVTGGTGTVLNRNIIGTPTS
jgi:hypothetical protein